MSTTGLAFRGWRHITVEDFIVLTPTGEIVEQTGGLGAAGTVLHLAVYAQLPRCGGIVHAHSPYATMFASLGVAAPSVVNRHDVLGPVPVVAVDDTAVKARLTPGDLPLPIPAGIVGHPAPYVINRALLPQVLDALLPRAQELTRHGLAFLIYRHGQMTVGRTIHEAVDNAYRVEDNARIAFYRALLAGDLARVHGNPLFEPISDAARVAAPASG